MDPTNSGHAAALWVGLNLLLLMVLSGLVVRLRQKHKIALGDGGVLELARAVRTFGNATEYVPTGMAALAVLAVVAAPPAAIHIAGFLLFAGRIIHAVGLFNTGGASIPRAIGIVLTWLGYLFAAVVLLLYAIA
jgi:uncharacterized membrane protein YecN with MAPEG domain